MADSIRYPDGPLPRLGDTVAFATAGDSPVRVTGTVTRVYAARQGSQKLTIRVPGGQAYGPEPYDAKRYTSQVAFVARGGAQR